MQLRLLVLFSILQAITAFRVSHFNLAPRPEISTRIINGTDAEDGIAPYQCSLQMDKFHICGCSIISSEWIVTAAHCVLSQVEENLRILVGSNDLESGGTYYYVEKYIEHENHGNFYETFYNDIAVIKVKGSIEFNDKVQPIEYSSEQVAAGAVLTLTGWGLNANGEIPRKLQTIQLYAISNEECLKIYQGKYVHQSHLCTLNKAGEGACNGDSGSPLVLNNKLFGLVSFGPVYCANGIPSGFSNVAYLYDWIKAHAQ